MVAAVLINPEERAHARNLSSEMRAATSFLPISESDVFVTGAGGGGGGGVSGTEVVGADGWEAGAVLAVDSAGGVEVESVVTAFSKKRDAGLLAVDSGSAFSGKSSKSRTSAACMSAERDSHLHICLKTVFFAMGG